MNPFLRKEIRLLLPAWSATVLLALSIWLLPEHLGSRPSIISSLLVFPFLFCPAMLIMTVLGSFGGEFSGGTFSVLLAQPVSRGRIWWTKTQLLFLAVLLVWFIWCYSQIASDHINANLRDMEIFTALFALAIYSGGLWTVLLLRQVAAAFWFTVLIPAALLMTVSNILQHYPDDVTNKVLIGVFALYGIAGYCFAYWLFMRAQDAQWSGGAIAIPQVHGLPVWLSMLARRRSSHPRTALWRKEFQLHQSQFIMALVLLAMNLGVIATRKLGHFPQNSGMNFVLETFWVLWLVIPFLVGCAAAAEERKLGTHAGQLCLPVRWRTQFAVKVSVVVLLSLLFGMAMPLLLEGTRVLPDAHINLLYAFKAQLELPKVPLSALDQNIFWNCLSQLNHIVPLLTLVGIAIGIGVVSFHISTLARNTLQALGPTVLSLILFAILMTAAETPQFADRPLWRGDLIYFIGLPVMLLTLLALALWNFRQLAPGWQLWLKNLLVLAGSLAFVVAATTATYHRTWEKLGPFEPAHGTARLTLTNPASLHERWNEISVRMPSGKIWTGYCISRSFSSNLVGFALGNIKVDTEAGGYIEGSNWASVRQCLGQWVGIKTDGTLWVSEKPRKMSGDWKKNEEEMRHLVQFGNETNWSSMEPFNISVLLVKNDGTLWCWRPKEFDFRHKHWPGLRSFTPYQLGTESNWAGFFESDGLRKMDGSIWESSYDPSDTNGVILKVDGFKFRAVPGMRLGQFHSTAIAVVYGLMCRAGIFNDGTLRIWASQHYNSRFHEMVWSTKDLQIGHVTDWSAVAGSGNKMVTLKDDGSLWLWDFYWNPRHYWNRGVEKYEIQNAVPSRLGIHSDWISVTSADNGVISLAADGSLWFWPLQRPSYYYNTGWQFEPLLDMQHKPIYLCNIFVAH